jgi:peptide deformylase
MILEVLKYGHPVLRQRGRRIETLTPQIRNLMSDMLETMYAHKGVGLAAQQVGIPVLLTVIDVRGVTDRPSSIEFNGTPGGVNESMPLVLVNPELKPVGDPVSGSEGCLSFPEIFGEIIRPESVDVRGIDKDGKPVEFRCGGLLARAIQHEADHLHGILFIDRMDRKAKDELRPELDALQAETKALLETSRKK